MRRIVMLVFLVISLVAMVAFSVTIEALFTDLGISFADITGLFTSGMEATEILSFLGILLSGLFNIYGIPLIIFLICFNGLMQVKKSDVK